MAASGSRALATATRNEAIVGFPAVVKAAALLVVTDDVGLAVAELLDLLRPVPGSVGAADVLDTVDSLGCSRSRLLVLASVVLHLRWSWSWYWTVALALFCH